jgi:signal transduction histidine kinase
MAQATSQDIVHEILSAINRNQEIVFVSYSALDETEKNIQYALSKILERHNKSDLYTPVYSSLKELVANAIKANAKYILIEEGEIKDPDDIMEVVNKVRNILNEESLLLYGIKAKQYRLSTRIYLKPQATRLIIEVINNLPVPQKELERMRERIERSSHYDSIADFYLENPDPAAEGMGLGLSMVVVLLKSVGIPYTNFTLYTDFKSKTVARIIIPLI